MFGRMRGQPTVPGASKRRPSSSPRQMPGSGPLICTSAPTGRSTSSIIIATLLSIRSGWPLTLTTPGIYITDRTAAESTGLSRRHKRLFPCPKTFDSARRLPQNLYDNCPARTFGGAGQPSAFWWSAITMMPFRLLFGSLKRARLPWGAYTLCGRSMVWENSTKPWSHGRLMTVLRESARMPSAWLSPTWPKLPSWPGSSRRWPATLTPRFDSNSFARWASLNLPRPWPPRTSC